MTKLSFGLREKLISEELPLAFVLKLTKPFKSRFPSRHKYSLEDKKASGAIPVLTKCVAKLEISRGVEKYVEYVLQTSARLIVFT